MCEDAVCVPRIDRVGSQQFGTSHRANARGAYVNDATVVYNNLYRWLPGTTDNSEMQVKQRI